MSETDIKGTNLLHSIGLEKLRDFCAHDSKGLLSGFHVFYNSKWLSQMFLLSKHFLHWVLQTDI